ncbi:sterol desaturase [Argonema galeatum]|uniref:sterol desaturase n=1 Tax=Argonema galeatum TaxID=2942762 RepID=UPI002011D01B|nr:sterol desaturase [Argonema galeatum]MCL1466914.1 sterol desaturase [Argonema galeatum A003/A1]
MEVLKAVLSAVLLLLIGDFISTFLYHVPEHIFGKFHTLVHHSQKHRSFIYYAVITRNPLVLIHGFMGVLPYLIFVPWLWQISPGGTILGLFLAELHVLWRHTSINDYRTSETIQRLCNFFSITTPERHWLHHKNGNFAYGDIFTFYDKPAQKWWRFLRLVKRKKFAGLGVG